MLGGDHPDTLASRDNLACVYRSVGDLGRAVPLFEATLAAASGCWAVATPMARIVRGNLEAAVSETVPQRARGWRRLFRQR
ncbi:hypothetical protein [Nonomuraea thailandensis]